MTKQPEQTVTVAEVVAWLTKKAGEYRATRGRQHAVVADAITTLASKVHRGAVRPNNVLGADLTTLDPIQLRWGLDDVMWGDDDTVTVLMSGPAGEPYWLELDPDRAVVLRGALAGPGGEQAAPADRAELRDRIAKALEREDAINAGYDHGFASSYGTDTETDGFVDAVLAVLPAPADRAAEVAELRAELKTYRYVSLNNAVLRTENRVLTEALDEAGDKIERLRADRAAVLREGASRLDARAEELDAAAKTSFISGLRGVRDARLDSAECWRGAADELRRMADEAQQDGDGEDCCGAEPPPNGPWGDCWCTLPPGHDGEHHCVPCTSRRGAAGWADAADKGEEL